MKKISNGNAAAIYMVGLLPVVLFFYIAVVQQNLIIRFLSGLISIIALVLFIYFSIKYRRQVVKGYEEADSDWRVSNEGLSFKDYLITILLMAVVVTIVIFIFDKWIK